MLQPVLDLMGWGMLFFEVSPECAYGFMVDYKVTDGPCLKHLIAKVRVRGEGGVWAEAECECKGEG